MKTNSNGSLFERNSLPVSHVYPIYVHVSKYFLKIIIIVLASCNSLLIISDSTVVIIHYCCHLHCHHPVLLSSLHWVQEMRHGALGHLASQLRPLYYVSQAAHEEAESVSGYYGSHTETFFPRLEPRLTSGPFTTARLSDRKACFPAASGLYFFLSLPPFISAVLGNIAKSPLDGGKHCKSLIPKLIL